MECSRDERRHRRLPRRYAGEYPERRVAAYRPVESGPDPLRTLDVARIGQYPLLTAWATLHNADLVGRHGLQVLDRAIDEKTIDVDGPIMSEVPYFFGDLVCDEQPGWRWNVDAWGLPVLALYSQQSRGPTVWDVLKFVKRRINQSSPSLVEAIGHSAANARGQSRSDGFDACSDVPLADRLAHHSHVDEGRNPFVGVLVPSKSKPLRR